MFTEAKVHDSEPSKQRLRDQLPMAQAHLDRAAAETTGFQDIFQEAMLAADLDNTKHQMSPKVCCTG